MDGGDHDTASSASAAPDDDPASLLSARRSHRHWVVSAAARGAIHSAQSTRGVVGSGSGAPPSSATTATTTTTTTATATSSNDPTPTMAGGDVPPPPGAPPGPPSGAPPFDPRSPSFGLRDAVAPPPRPPPVPPAHPPPETPPPPRPPQQGQGSEGDRIDGEGGGDVAFGTSSLLVTPGLSASLHGAATDLGAPRPTGFGSAFQSPGVASGGAPFRSPGMASIGGRASFRTPGGYGGAALQDEGTLTPGTPLTARGDRRSRAVRERARSSAAFAGASFASRGGEGEARRGRPAPLLPPAALAELDDAPDARESEDAAEAAAAEGGAAAAAGRLPPLPRLPSLFASFCHRGMEVIFAAVNHEAEGGHLLGIHARTRAPFQKLRPARDSASAVDPPGGPRGAFFATPEIVQMASHPSNGWIYAADSVGNVHSFRPVRADPAKEAYGKFRWVLGPVARTREVFGYDPLDASGTLVRTSFSNRGSLRSGDSIEVADDGFEVEVEVEEAAGSGPASPRPARADSDTFSLDARLASRSGEGPAGGAGGDGRTCFRRKGRCRRDASRLSREDASGSRESPRDGYRLTDGQPPLPGAGRSADEGGEGGAIVCASATERRVLVAHKDRLAVYDFSMSSPAGGRARPQQQQRQQQQQQQQHQQSHSGASAAAPSQASPPEARLVWTHALGGTHIDHASLSGDGRAVAVALRGEGVGVPYPFGVRTFVQEREAAKRPHNGDKKDATGKEKDASAPAGGKDGASGATSGRPPAPTPKGGGGKPPVPTPPKADGRPPPGHRRKGSGMEALSPRHAPPLPGTPSKPHTKAQRQDAGDALEDVFASAAKRTTDSVEAEGGAGSSGGSDSGPAKGEAPKARRAIAYEPGQFLVHSAPVTRLAFRGYGTVTSSAGHTSLRSGEEDGGGDDARLLEEGNDLLLTSCASDASVRIFSQNSWRQLMHWNGPPRSRADWVRGISAANLGDLDDDPAAAARRRGGTGEDVKLTPIPKRGVGGGGGGGDSSLSRRGSEGSSVGGESDDASGGINRALLAGRHHRHATAPRSPFPQSSVPGTHAGAWIAELTFRNAFPALRLSRLSYMKTGGDDAVPAHFESVAAILPPGSLSEEAILDDDEGGGVLGFGECRLEVEGIWPAWDPWEADVKAGGGAGGGGARDAAGRAKDSGEGDQGRKEGPTSTLKGSLTAPSPLADASPRWLGDGLSDLGGSHLPPSELRITSSSGPGDRASLSSGSLVHIEMPLWGDRDLGAMEFGSAARHEMLLPPEALVGQEEAPSADLDYESGSRLCAISSPDRKSIELCWRRHGAVNLEEIVADGNDDDGDKGVRTFRDLSLTPLPLSLPSLTLPGRHGYHRSSDDLQSLARASEFDKHALASLHWWPDENFGGPPRLAALTRGGTIVVYEMPPPWSALEPPMPDYDPFDSEGSRGSSIEDDFSMSDDGSVPMVVEEILESGSFTGNSRGAGTAESKASEFEVSITPHPDFGIGLRLEAQVAGMPAMAGSFKKHPLSGGRLPAERSGAIVPGDELLAVNDVSLVGMTFEDAIAAVRQIGFDSCGAPLRMRFRRGRRRRSTAASSGEGSGSKRITTTGSRGSGGRVAQEASEGRGAGDAGSLATVEVGADAEIQQGFGRIIAVVRGVIVAESPGNGTGHSPPAMLLLPWNFGKGATVSHKMYGGALILWAATDGRGTTTVRAARLEAVLDVDPNSARFLQLGSICLGDEKTGPRSVVKSITFVSSTERGWLAALIGRDGGISLLFVDIVEVDEPILNGDPTSGATNLKATFRHYPGIFNIHGNNHADFSSKRDPRDSFILRSHSLELFGGMERTSECQELKVWAALPHAMGRGNKNGDAPKSSEYQIATICIDDISQLSSDEVILDFLWVHSGHTDAFPWLVVFTTSSVVVYHRCGANVEWRLIAVLMYKERLSSVGMMSKISAQNAFPHMTSALRALGLPNDESGVLRSDCHPESILASICTEESGVSLALRSHVRGLYVWLSRCVADDKAGRPPWVADGSGPSALVGAPFRVVTDRATLASEDEEKDEEESSASLIAAMSLNTATTQKRQPEDEVLLEEFLASLSFTADNGKPDDVGPTRSREFIMAMSFGNNKSPEKKESKKRRLPTPLMGLNEDQRLCLWAIGNVLSKPPSFKKLDPLAQHCLFGFALMRLLLEGKNNEAKAEIKTKSSMPEYEGGRPTTVLSMHSSNGQKESVTFNTVASASMLSALMSDDQARLLERCRPKGEKLDWETVRSVGAAHWVRSKKLLAAVADEIASTVYKRTKSVMDCALFYVAARNMKKLRAIASTDRSTQGKKFLKFIMDNDFTSERGRVSAEKNAYSLLRKRMYREAASFFMLAEPPMIKTALDVIRLQMKDTALAFFVARLAESAAPKLSDGALTLGGGFNLGNMGGGGGFAGGGGSMGGAGGLVEAEGESAVKFDDWKPDLRKSARSVLLSKDQENEADTCFEALQLLWLGRLNEARLCLSFSEIRKGNAAAGVDLPFPLGFSMAKLAESSANASSAVLKKANEIVNFCTGPSLLKRMRPKKRILWTSALLVARALGRCGMEVSSLRILSQVADPAYEEEGGETTSVSVNTPSSGAPSSIFEAYDAAPTKPGPTNLSKQPGAAALKQSSIFDSFDAAPAKPKAAAPKPSESNPTSSSIFDSFDTAPPKKKPEPASPKPSQSDSMSSSIFDSFDAAPPKPKSTPAKSSQSDSMSSSIFDSFDAAPPKPKPAPTKASESDPMSSSIFDSFDAAPPKPKPTPPKPSQSDPMSSSIFDSFDAAPPMPKPAPTKASQSDPMSSSIFDSFDAAPPKPKPTPPKASQSDPMSSSIFDSFDAVPQKRPPRSPAQRPTSRGCSDAENEIEKEQPFDIPPCPELWNEWRNRLIHVVAARRFLRELARIVSSFDGEPTNIGVAMQDFSRRNYPLVPTGAAEVLHNACDGGALLGAASGSLSELGNTFSVDEAVVLELALELLSSERSPRRVVFAVLIQCLLGRGDLAEDLIRDAASLQMDRCEFLGFSNDSMVDTRDSRYYTSSLWARRDFLSMIWQLELCLWLHRGAAFDLSSVAIKETLLAVRVGLAAAAWGRCHLSLDTLIKAEPDCLMDFDAGKNLWRSMKIIIVNDSTVEDIDGVTSGGWEFLVDCRREEATEMLRDGKTGQFLIRPHPQDPGVFTLSFKTNLVPTEPEPSTNGDDSATGRPSDDTLASANSKKVVKRDDVVQHAIIRLSDSGFRCGSFGPFATLVKLLHAVSESLPFDLRFGDPPIKGIISEKGTQTSPNSFLFRKLALHSKAQLFQFQNSKNIKVTDVDDCLDEDSAGEDSNLRDQAHLHRKFGLSLQLMFLTELRKQLCAVAAAEEYDPNDGNDEGLKPFPDFEMDDDFDGSITEGSLEADDEESLGVASRMVKPLLNWVRSREIDIIDELAPPIRHQKQISASNELSSAINALGDEHSVPSSKTGGDSIIRRMIQSGSGVAFRTLRVGETGNSVIVVLFAKQDAIKWLMSNETSNDEAEAKALLNLMEVMRVIEPITSGDLSIPKSYAASHPSTESRYRFVDPWEVEALESRSGETASAILGRRRFEKLGVGLIANSCEKIVRAAGGLHLLGLWSTLKGGITLTKALCSALPSWERDAGGDLLMKKGFLMEPSPYDNSIRQHLYGNYLFRRLELPQRFLALVQVELLDLKNVTSPSGSSSLTAYALLRLKRQGSSAPLNHKARSLDSACTTARKISKSSGPNAPASWGSLVRFRFPLPEDVNCEGRSFDKDRESLFKGPPTCLQITVYEKKFMSDTELGGADVNLESLGSGGQIEEWVPLRAAKDGITWFARIRLSLRFELLCLDSISGASETDKKDRRLSVGLKKIQKLSRLGAHEDHKQGVKNSISTPDLVGYFGNMLY
ncbi:hypothetical protein ACHAWF_016877 [Thalassiosira exigua]